MISLEGELLQHDAPRVMALLELAGDTRAIVVDCADVTRMHACVIAMLVCYARRCPDVRLSVRLGTASLRRAFELMGISRILRVI